MLLTEKEAKHLCDKLLTYCTADDAEVSAGSDDYSHLRFAANGFTTNGRRESASASTTVWIGQRQGSASTTALDDVSLQQAVREAEQLAAMGKISEIIGKRSAQVTGEVMVEVGSSKQQLKTPWSQRQAAHSEAGSEIHRDEVPLMYQQFVQQYFEEIRKSSEPKPAAAKPATAKKPG